MPNRTCNGLQLSAEVCNRLQLSAEVCNRLQPLKAKGPDRTGARGKHADASRLYGHTAARPKPDRAVATPTMSTQSRAEDKSECTDLTETPSVPAISCSVRPSQ